MDHMLGEAVEWQLIFLSMEMIVDCIEQWMVLKQAPQTSGRPPNPFQGFLGPCQRVHEVKTILMTIQRHLPFSLYWICTDGAKTVSGKTTAFAWIKATALNLGSGHCTPHHDPVGKKKCLFHLRMSLMMKQKSSILLNLDLGVELFLIFCDEMGSKH